MPDWTIVERPRAATDYKKAARASVEPDAVSPSLSALKQSATGKPTRDSKPVPPKGKARFVEVRPKAGALDARGSTKVALVRDGKVVLQQG